MSDPDRILACPRCAGKLTAREGRWICVEHGVVIVRRDDGLLDALTPEDRAEHHLFLQEYNAIRAREGREGSVDLPFVPDGHPYAAEWRHRRATMEWLIDRLGEHRYLPGGTILDAGAGVCWLSRRLALAGGEVVALDVNDDRCDGLAGGSVMLHGGVRFHRVLGDMEHLPFAENVFDAIVFNGAFHYAQDRRETIAGAIRVLRPGGVVVIVDSPVYRWARSGDRMIAARGRGRSGYLTFSELRELARSLDLDLTLWTDRPTFAKRMRRLVIGLRLGREPALMPRIMFSRRMAAPA